MFPWESLVSESTEPIPVIPNGMTVFRLQDGPELKLDLIETFFRFQELLQEFAEKSYLELLRAIISHVRDRTGVELTVGQADWLRHTVDCEWLLLKKKRDEELKSLSSTASTPGL
jgi:hypothetical protein